MKSLKSSYSNINTAFQRYSQRPPNKAEFLILGIISYYKLSFEYTGNGTFLIGNKIPDFVFLKEKKVIELFGKHWHKNPNEEKDRTDFFKSAGFETLIIYDTELKASNLGTVINKMIKFNKKVSGGIQNF